MISNPHDIEIVRVAFFILVNQVGNAWIVTFLISLYEHSIVMHEHHAFSETSKTQHSKLNDELSHEHHAFSETSKTSNFVQAIVGDTTCSSATARDGHCLLLLIKLPITFA